MSDSTSLNPFPTITFAEIVDIIFVAILLYTAIVWAQRTRAAFVVRGIVILGAIYIIARYLDLQMTAWIFQGFFAVFLIMIVVTVCYIVVWVRRLPPAPEQELN